MSGSLACHHSHSREMLNAANGRKHALSSREQHDMRREEMFFATSLNMSEGIHRGAADRACTRPVRRLRPRQRRERRLSVASRRRHSRIDERRPFAQRSRQLCAAMPCRFGLGRRVSDDGATRSVTNGQGAHNRGRRGQ